MSNEEREIKEFIEHRMHQYCIYLSSKDREKYMGPPEPRSESKIFEESFYSFYKLFCKKTMSIKEAAFTAARLYKEYRIKEKSK
jgi:hypothetical protein